MHKKIVVLYHDMTGGEGISQMVKIFHNVCKYSMFVSSVSDSENLDI